MWHIGSHRHYANPLEHTPAELAFLNEGQNDRAPKDKAPETITQEADRLVNGPRQASYGHPLDDFTRTGKLWGAILGTDPIAPELVGLCLAAVKISRECNAPKRDNRVDLAGYAATVDLVITERERRGTDS